MRATFIPAAINARRTAGDEEAGPIVQTTLVRAMWMVEVLEVIEVLEVLKASAL
jgi:hypothetical protein